MADEEKAVFVGLKNDAEDSLPKAASHFGEFHEGTASELSGQIEKHASDDLNLKSEIDGLDQTPAQTGASNIVTRTTSTGATRDVQYYSFSDEELEAAGITSKGADDVETGGTDPVDLVSGQLIASATDLVRLGVLPLALRRAYTSGYAHGGMFGPGWASTLDIRLLIDEDGIRFLGESAQVLDYGVPAGLNLGLPAAPLHGARWPLSRERDCYRVDDPDTGTSWLFPREGDGEVRALQEIRDRNGNRIVVARPGSGAAMIELAHSGGFRAQAELLDTPAGPRVAALSLLPGDGAGISVLSYAYDEVGRLVAITDSTGVAYLYEWDEQDRIRGWVDRNGHDYQYTYDEDGRVIATWGAGGFLTSQIAYDRANRVTRVTDGAGATAAYHYDRYQQVVKIVDPVGNAELIERDRYGRVLACTDPLGATARTERDGSGLPLRFTAPDGAETQLAYNGSGQPVRVTEPNGAIWSLEYDACGNLARRTDPLGGQVTYTYDTRGGITAVTDSLGAVTRFELDDAGLQTGVTDPLGGRWRIRRDVFGRVTAVIDPAGSERRSLYSIEGQLLRSEDNLGGAVRYAYDPVGNLIERVDAAGAVTRFEYGPMGLRTASIDAVGNRHTFTYDSELRLTGVTGPTGLEWAYTYDAAGRLVGERDFDGRELTYRLDAAGRRIEQVSGSGEHTRFDYDAAGRLTGRVATGVEHRFAYDATGHMVRAEGSGTLLEITRDLLSRPVAESVNGRVLTRDYDPAGNLVRRVTPGGAVTEWSFDAAGNPLRLATASAEITFGYDYAGREIVRRFGPAVELRRGYDAAGRMTGARLSAGDWLLQERAYAYRADGAVERISDHLRGVQHYALDPLGRATSVQAGQHVEAYAYDRLGTVRAAAEAPSAVTAGTQLRQDARFSYGYDADGRLVAKQQRNGHGDGAAWTYSWDALGHLTGVITPDRGVWRYAYDPLGRRNAKIRLDADGVVVERTEFTYDGPRLIEERHVDASGVTHTTTWDYEPDSFLPAAQTRRQILGGLSQQDVDEQFQAIIADLVGTPLELVAADGTVTALGQRSLWGGARPSEPDAHDAQPCPLRFPGHYYDAETGLHYNLHRYYDPITASYLSPDPLGLLPAPNPRTYIGNPLTESDPLGLNGEGVDKPVPGLNLSGAKRVPYGEDPMSKLAITARRSFKNGLTSGKNVAVYLYRDGENNVRALAIHSDLVHSERLGWSTLSDKLGIGKDQIDSVYTELQPCGPIYHDCDQWLSKNMDGVPVSYSFDYGPTKAGQTAGMNSLRRALTQVRQGNLPK